MSDEITPKTTLVELLEQGCDIILPMDGYRIGRFGAQLFWTADRTIYRNRGEVTAENVKRLLTEVRLAQEDREIQRAELD